MRHIYRFFIVGGLLCFSCGALSKVGPVSSQAGKIAACTYALGKGDNKDVNPANVIANLGSIIKKPGKSKKQRRTRRGGRSGSVR